MSDDLIIDLSNYKDRVGSKIDPGRYRVLVEDAEKDTSNAGNDMINVWLRVMGGPFDGAVIVDRLTLTEKALFRVVNFMSAIGLPTPRKRVKVNLRQFVGKMLDIDVEDGEPYNGRTKSEVRGYLRIARSASADNGQEVLDLDDLGAEEPPQDVKPMTKETVAKATGQALSDSPGGLEEFATPEEQVTSGLGGGSDDLSDLEDLEDLDL